MKVFNKDWIIDLQKSILWQYDKAQKLSDLIIQKGAWYKSNVTDFVVDFFWNIFNLRTANDFGLNIWGKILNFPRQIVLSYGEHAGEVYELSKAQYRFLLIGQVLKFQMDTTIPEINKYLSVIFPNNNGTCYVIDNQDMTINYSIADGFLTDEIKVLVDNYEFLPRPAGVKITVGTTGTYILRLEVISEGVPTTQFPTGIQLNITKNGTTVEPIISDNGYELTVSNEDVLSWQITYNNEVIDSNTDFTISQNTTQYGYITRLLKIKSVPDTIVGINPMPDSWMAYIQNGVITLITSEGYPISLPEKGLYVISKSSIRWTCPNLGSIAGYSSRYRNISEISRDIIMTVHLLPNDMKVKSLDVLNNRNTGLFDILETEIDETGSYKVTLKGEQGGVDGRESTAYTGTDIQYQEYGDRQFYDIKSAGGILSFDINLTAGDIVKLKRINGGYEQNNLGSGDQQVGFPYVGGSGIALWINNELIAVVGGGSAGGRLGGTPSLGTLYYSAGGGGYNGGFAKSYIGSNFTLINSSGYSVTGNKGNSTIYNQDACGSYTDWNVQGTSEQSGRGGSSYIKNDDSRVSNINQTYGQVSGTIIGGTILQGNTKEGKITITKNS